MIALLDTQALIWWGDDDRRLSARAREVITSPTNEILWSIASTWEMAIKSSLGKLDVKLPVRAYLPKAIERLGLRRLPIEERHAWIVERLPFHHRDPFDRMLLAQAMAERIPIVSADRRFDLYGIERIW